MTKEYPLGFYAAFACLKERKVIARHKTERKEIFMMWAGLSLSKPALVIKGDLIHDILFLANIWSPENFAPDQNDSESSWRVLSPEEQAKLDTILENYWQRARK